MLALLKLIVFFITFIVAWQIKKTGLSLSQVWVCGKNPVTAAFCVA